MHGVPRLGHMLCCLLRLGLVYGGLGGGRGFVQGFYKHLSSAHLVQSLAVEAGDRGGPQKLEGQVRGDQHSHIQM